VVGNDTDADGTIDPTSVVITQQPEHGTLTVDPTTGKVTYKPDPDYHGKDEFAYKVKDDDGAFTEEAKVSIDVRDVNDNPEANDDHVDMDEDTNATINVLTNDKDKDGTLDPTTVTITKQPEHGKVIVDPITGVVTYIPDPDYHGRDTFEYTVRDEDGGVTEPATVTLNIADVLDLVDIEAFIWADDNGNKQYDADEEHPIVGVIVELLDAQGNTLERKQVALARASEDNPYVGVTDENGKYTFRGLPFGSYTLRFSLSQEAKDDGYRFGDGSDSFVAPVDATNGGVARVAVETSVECGCENVASDSADALSPLSMAIMMLLGSLMALVGLRRQN
jgi:hypothetical protein